MMDIKELLKLAEAQLGGEEVEEWSELAQSWWPAEPALKWARKNNFRIKPKPMELWVNVYCDVVICHSTQKKAVANLQRGGETKLFREVTE